MILTTENLPEWKAELNRIAKPHFGDNFAECIPDEDWIANRLGDTTDEVLSDELYYSSQN